MIARARDVAILCSTLVLAAAPAVAQSQPAEGSRPAQTTAASQELRLPAADRSFSRLFQQIGGDFRGLPERQRLVWLGIGAGLSLASHGADRDVTRTLASSAGVEAALDPGRVLGGVMAQLGGAAATYVVGRLTNHTGTAHIGSDLIRAQVLTQALTQSVKLTARRTRPDRTSLSFPSGHTASAFASATVLERHFGWKAGLPAYALATYVGASRLSENRHFLSDVIFGATVGIVAARTVTIGHGSSRFALTPLVTQGGAGVALVKVSR